MRFANQCILSLFTLSTSQPSQNCGCRAPPAITRCVSVCYMKPQFVVEIPGSHLENDPDQQSLLLNHLVRSSTTQEAVLLPLEAAQRFSELTFDDSMQQRDNVLSACVPNRGGLNPAVCMQKQITSK